MRRRMSEVGAAVVVVMAGAGSREQGGGSREQGAGRREEGGGRTAHIGEAKTEAATYEEEAKRHLMRLMAARW